VHCWSGQIRPAGPGCILDATRSPDLWIIGTCQWLLWCFATMSEARHADLAARLNFHTPNKRTMAFRSSMLSHHHFVGERSGRISDIPWESLSVSKIQLLKGFEVKDYQLIVYAPFERGCPCKRVKNADAGKSCCLSTLGAHFARTDLSQGRRDKAG
jgi:hypothetical protein